MNIEIEGQVGPAVLSDGTNAPFRQIKDGSIATGHALARYEEMCRRGVILSVSTAAAGVTIASAHVSPLTANTGQSPAGLFNPTNSSYDLIILRAKMWTVSGTAGGPFVWNVITAPAGITATPAQGRRHDTGVLDGPLVGFTGTSALTGSLAGVMLRGMGGPAAIAAGAGLYGYEEETAGDIVVLPGQFAGLAATAAGSAHVAGASITYAIRAR